MRDAATTRSGRTVRSVESEDVHLRNYDARETHHLWLRAAGEDRTVERTYRLGPGTTESETDLLPPGEYDVEVELDGLRRWAGRCRVDDGPEHTVLVEVGNGLVSITEGIPR
jgi:hypothetical protein